MARGIERPKAVADRIGIGLTTLNDKFVARSDDDDPYVPGTNGKVKRVRPVAMGERWVGFFSDETDELIEQLRAWRDDPAHALPKRAVAPENHPSRHRRRADRRRDKRAG